MAISTFATCEGKRERRKRGNDGLPLFFSFIPLPRRGGGDVASPPPAITSFSTSQREKRKKKINCCALKHNKEKEGGKR